MKRVVTDNYKLSDPVKFPEEFSDSETMRGCDDVTVSTFRDDQTS